MYKLRDWNLAEKNILSKDLHRSITSKQFTKNKYNLLGFCLLYPVKLYKCYLNHP